MLTFFKINDDQEVNAAHIVRLMRDGELGTNLCLTGGTVLHVDIPLEVVKCTLEGRPVFSNNLRVVDADR